MATSKIGLHDLDSNLKNQIIHDAIATKNGTVWNVVTKNAPTANELYAVRFIASEAFVKNDTLTINGVSYTLSTVNGKTLGDSAWAANTIVQLNIEPESKTAFFNGGGVDLSFITAEAEHIREGYVGADIDGNPVYGDLVPKIASVLSITPTAYNSSSGGRYRRGIQFTVALDFVPDFLWFSGYFTALGIRHDYSVTLYDGCLHGRTIIYQNSVVSAPSGVEYVINDTTVTHGGMAYSKPITCDVLNSENYTINVSRTSSGDASTDISVTTCIALKF